MATAETALPGEEEIDYEGLGDNVPLHINMVAGALAGISELICRLFPCCWISILEYTWANCQIPVGAGGPDRGLWLAKASSNHVRTCARTLEPFGIWCLSLDDAVMLAGVVGYSTLC